MGRKPIILDCLGGDQALESNTRAVAELIQNDKIPLILVGPEGEIRRRLLALKVREIPDSFSFEDCQRTVQMDQVSLDILKDKNNSICRCLEWLKQGRGAAVVSAGHTGAVFMAAVSILGRMEGVLRPALGIVYPSYRGPTMLLDVGANVDTRPQHLVQFGVMGAIYYSLSFGIQESRIGLVSIGEEATKGSRVVREAGDLFKKMNHVPLGRFVGMVDGSELFLRPPEVLVTDGFVGNLLVKATESLVERMELEFRSRILQSHWLAKLGFWMSKPVWRSLKQGFDFREIGGVPMFGLKGNVFVCHGRSDGPTIAQCVRRAWNLDFGVYRQLLDQALSTLKM